MDLRLIFFIILFVLYAAHDVSLSLWFRKKYHKDDKFIGKKAPDDVQRYFGRAVYSIMIYYLLVAIFLITEFDFWGLISNISILDRVSFQTAGFVLSLVFLFLMTLARLNLGSSWRVGLDYSTSDALITHGFYRFIRNPYFAFLLAFEGSLILICPNAIVICAFIQSAILLGLQVRLEEIFLKEKYGKQYLLYKKTTGRFLPKTFSIIKNEISQM